MKLNLFIILFLATLFNSNGQRLYFFDRESPKKVEKIYVTKNVGFVKNIIDNTGNSTVLRSEFNNLKAERIAEHFTSFPKAEYLGYAFNGEEHIYLFLDTYNRVIYIPKYNKEGKFITNQRSKLKSNVKNTELIYYDLSAFYTVRRKGPRFTFTKISYRFDTLWEKEVFDNGKTIVLNKAEKSDSNFYLIFNSPEASTRIIAIDDAKGELIFDREIGESGISRYASKFIIKKGPTEIIIVGKEILGGKKAGLKSGTFINTMNEKGNFESTTFYPDENIKLDVSDSLDFDSKERIKQVKIRDLIMLNDEYLLIGENTLRTDFAGEGMIVSLIVGGLTGLPVGSMEHIVYTSFDLILIKTRKDSLIYKQLDKGPIARFFPTVESSYDRDPGDFYDYKFSRETPEGKEIFFFQNLTKDSFTIGSVKITPDQPFKVKKFILKEKNERGKNYNIYLLSDNALLLQNKTNSSSGYGIINFSKFE
ncbi:MAG TPA: hypothetical protein VD908_01645 [Cytophagales bacterium]|nr:hypothetical protein [Cytophagales bacterium]